MLCDIRRRSAFYKQRCVVRAALNCEAILSGFCKFRLLLLLLMTVAGTAACPAQAKGEQHAAVPSMRKYVDASFGFSFWYPAAWTLKRDDRVPNPTHSGWYRGGKVVQRLSMRSPGKPGGESDWVSIEVLSVPAGELTERGSLDKVSPVATDRYYSFDGKTPLRGDAGETMGRPAHLLRGEPSRCGYGCVAGPDPLCRAHDGSR
jgi:hypothetical protein